MGRVLTYVLAFIVGGFLTYAGTESLMRSLTNPRYFTLNMEHIMVVLIGHILLAYIPSSIAGHKGHSYIKWLVYGFFLPPIAFIHSLLVKNYETDYKECPFCAERIKKAAKVCRFCGREIPLNTIDAQKKLDENNSNAVKMIYTKPVLFIILLIILVIFIVSTMFTTNS